MQDERIPERRTNRRFSRQFRILEKNQTKRSAKHGRIRLPRGFFFNWWFSLSKTHLLVFYSNVLSDLC